MTDEQTINSLLLRLNSGQGAQTLPPDVVIERPESGVHPLPQPGTEYMAFRQDNDTWLLRIVMQPRL